MEKLYSTEIRNENGTRGSVELVGGTSYPVSSPLEKDHDGFNPEQLMGMAWSTCLNATLISLLKAQSKEHVKSRVRVVVDMCKESEMVGYFFRMKAYVSVEGFSLDETQKIAKQADRFCPVSKLIKQNPHVTLESEIYVIA